jgi:hypothetical protein
MNALAFIEKHGKEVATAVAEAAGTNFPYLSQIAHGHRRPSVELAEKLVATSAERFPNPEEQLDFVSLMKSKDRADRAAA